MIKVKENAPDLLRRALSRTPVDVIATGDYQLVERKFGLSRKMLEVCLEFGFPVSVLERSPWVTRDLDLLHSINEQSSAVVFFSIISAPGSPHYDRVCQMEQLAPRADKRFAAMEEIAKRGLLTGTCMMPIMQDLCDDHANLENVVRWTADHGGRFVMVGGLTLSDQQRTFFFGVLAERFPDLLERYQALYPPKSYGPVHSEWEPLALCAKALCQKYGILDRIPRPIIPGEKRALNMRVVEVLANQCYDLELNGEPEHKVWAYRKAAWAIEDTPQDLGVIYRQMGYKGLESIQNVGPALAQIVERLVKGWTSG